MTVTRAWCRGKRRNRSPRSAFKMLDSEASVTFVYDSPSRDFPSYSLENDARLTTAFSAGAHKTPRTPSVDALVNVFFPILIKSVYVTHSCDKLAFLLKCYPFQIGGSLVNRISVPIK